MKRQRTLFVKSPSVKHLWLRVGLMAVSLAAISYTLYKTYHHKSPNQLEICPTRVQQIELKSEKGFLMTQEGRDWKLTQPTQMILGSLDVEKWLGRYCYIAAEKMLSSDHVPQSSKEIVRLGLISGQNEELLSMDGELFYWRGSLYRSPEWPKMLNDLKALAPGI